MTDKLQELMELGSERESMTPSLRARLDEMAKQAMNLENEIEQKEEEVKLLKAERNQLIQKELPTTLQSLGLSMYKTTDGLKVDIKTIVTGSLPKEEERRREAIAIIKTSGGEDLFTNDVSITFGKGQEEDARKVMEAIGRLGYNHAQQQSSVHPQTLCAWAREMMANGQPLETEKLGLFVGPVAKVTFEKKRGGQ